MNKKRSFVRVLKWSFRIFVLIIAFLLFKQYIWDKKYKFPEAKPFSGNFFYNPYRNIDTSLWAKANFHVHTLSWMGLTNGRKNNDELVDSLYTYLGYKIFSISDYQKINPYLQKKPDYIPVYEHGYLPPKNHQLVLNAKKVSWLDYLFPQTIHNKQNVINTIKNDSSVLAAIAHPCLQNSYKPEDFKKLSGYDLMEVLNQNRFSLVHWDSALSSGHPAFILADDDSHDLKDIYTGGRCCTFINSVLEKDLVLDALKCGRAYGADVKMHPDEPYSQKKIVLQQLTLLQNLTIHNDTLYLILSDTVRKIKFIGQGGQLKKEIKNAKDAFYEFSSDDTYIRTEVITNDESALYFNPVFRYNGNNIPVYKTSADNLQTWIWRSFFFILLLSCFFIYKLLKKNKRHEP